MTTGEYIPSDEDILNLSEWVKRFEHSILPPHRIVKQPADWEKFNDAYEKHIGYSNAIPKGQVQNFYQSKFFRWYLPKGDGVCMPNLITFHTEAAFNKFIKSSGYLIYRCMVGEKQPNGKRFCAAYYHKTYGKVGWLKSKLQFWVNKLDAKNGLVKWLYNLEKNPAKYEFNIHFQRIVETRRV